MLLSSPEKGRAAVGPAKSPGRPKLGGNVVPECDLLRPLPPMSEGQSSGFVGAILRGVIGRSRSCGLFEARYEAVEPVAVIL
jgi:hypothetical protein